MNLNSWRVHRRGDAWTVERWRWGAWSPVCTHATHADAVRVADELARRGRPVRDVTAAIGGR